MPTKKSPAVGQGALGALKVKRPDGQISGALEFHHKRERWQSHPE
jgi:hypothetical protein